MVNEARHSGAPQILRRRIVSAGIARLTLTLCRNPARVSRHTGPPQRVGKKGTLHPWLRPEPEGKIVSVFEPQTEVTRKGKEGKPTDFGKLVTIQEADNQIVTHHEVFDEQAHLQRFNSEELACPDHLE
jgi:hypothetical protein